MEPFPPSIKALAHWWSVEESWSLDRSPSSLRLLASERKPTFLSTNLASLLAFKGKAARPHFQPHEDVVTHWCCRGSSESQGISGPVALVPEGGSQGPSRGGHPSVWRSKAAFADSFLSMVLMGPLLPLVHLPPWGRGRAALQGFRALFIVTTKNLVRTSFSDFDTACLWSRWTSWDKQFCKGSGTWTWPVLTVLSWCMGCQNCDANEQLVTAHTKKRTALLSRLGRVPEAVALQTL